MRRASPILLLLAACGGEEAADGTADEVPITMGGEIAPAPGVYPFQGTWSSGWGCDPEGANAPLVITTRSFTYGGAACAVVSVEEIAPSAAYNVALDCQAEGSRYEAVQRVTVDGDRLTIEGERGAGTFARCEPSPEGE